MKHNLLTTAPKYCPEAIPTARGWVHPVTSELLHAIKLDLTQFNKQVEEQTKSTVDAEPAVVDVESAVVESAVVESAVVDVESAVVEPAVVEPAVVDAEPVADESAVVEPVADESAVEPKPAKSSKTSKA
jgi:uncharacterized membrane protein